MREKDWDSELYLKFAKENNWQCIDLISHINLENPSKIIDIGCGPGNVTQLLAQRWPKSHITGIDNSQSMIERAKKDFPNLNWELVDAGKDEISGEFDIIFSRATIQWIPNHFELLIKLRSLLSDNGIIAIQLPLFFDMPVGKSIALISKSDRWSKFTKGVNELFTIHNYSEYHDLLSKLFSSFNIWESNYIYVLNSQYSILERIRTTGLKPYLDQLENDIDKNEFEETVLAEIKKEYPLQKNGKVLFPFKRLAFIAKK